MTDFRVSWTDTARRDLDEILDFIAADSPINSLAVLDRLQQGAAALVSQPERGRCVPELQAVDVSQYRELLEPPWRIVYRTEGENVLVMAVLDGRRDLQSLLLERLTRA